MEPASEPLPDLNNLELDMDLLASDLNRYFPSLVLNFQQRLYAFALRYAGVPQDAEDITQEAFIRAYHALADYPAERIRAMKMQPWLYKIALHICYRHNSNKRLHYTSLDLSEEQQISLALEDDERGHPEKMLEEREEIRELEAMIARLPEPYRIAISCYYFEELGYREIAELLNLPVGTIKSNVYRGTQLLRKSLQAQQSL
jgi:RNA polymerase sigma-70 factor, ECF subfamily